MQPRPVKKILIIRFSSIGDIVLTTPVIRALKTQLDDVEVHFCTKAEYAPVLEANPYLDKVHFLGKDGLGPLVKTLKAERFGAVVDLHKNTRTRLLRARLGVKGHAYDKLNPEKWLMVNFKINRLPNIHIVDRYMQAAAPLGIKNDGLGLDYFIPDKDEVVPGWLPPGFQEQYVVYAIGGQHATKRLPVDRMIELCDKINKPVILLGGKEDAPAGETVEAFFMKQPGGGTYEEGLLALNKKTSVFNGCGKFSLNQSASVLKRAVAVFTHDTGLMHIAAAFKKPVYSIWGNTIPQFGMYPYNTKFTVFENNSLGCRPCTKIGFDRCPKGHFKCMNNLIFDFYLP